jgi:hypothetical protein
VSARVISTYDTKLEKWEKSNRIASMIIKGPVSAGIRGAIAEKNQDGVELTAMEFMASIGENFKGSSRIYASTLIMKMCTSRYDGQCGIREHIMSMCDMAVFFLRGCDMAVKLKALDMSISEGFLVHFIMTSLPTHYTPTLRRERGAFLNS